MIYQVDFKLTAQLLKDENHRHAVSIEINITIFDQARIIPDKRK